LPASSVIERTAIAGRARARRRATDALLAPVSNEQIAKLDRLFVPDASVNMTPFAWLKAMPVAPEADHIRELLDRLRRLRDVGLPSEITMRIHEERLRQFVREGYASDAHQLGRYTAHRRRAILVATTIDLEARLTDAVLDMADKHIGGLFAKARNTTRRRYAASPGDVSRLMRMFTGRSMCLLRHRPMSATLSRPSTRRLAGRSCCACAARSRTWQNWPTKIHCSELPTAGEPCAGSHPT